MMEDTYHLGIKALIRDDHGSILLLQTRAKQPSRSNYWDLPGGRVNRGERVEETLRREIDEEIGPQKLTNVTPLAMVVAAVRIPLHDGHDAGLILDIYTCSIALPAVIRLREKHIVGYD